MKICLEELEGILIVMLDFKMLENKQTKVAVVGLGYVGLPLAVGLAKKFDVIGFDINKDRIAMLNKGHDNTLEVEDDELKKSTATFTANAKYLKEAKVIIVAVPTPVDSYCTPDLSPVLGASRTVGQNMSKGCIVCYESTVYPGVTEDECVPVLEKESGLQFGKDFTVGYSPERINPGDKVNRLETICKVVAGSDEKTSDILVNLYGAIVTAGIHKAPTIKVAEACKVIENTQRDINIALMNELALIFNKMGIDTLDVLEASGTKWNFLPFRPGLVGGHCIGVDPYYLTYKAQELGYHPEIILAGRRINTGMGEYIASTCVKKLIESGRNVKGARVGILGFTFKENVPDIRNTRIMDVVNELKAFGVTPLVYDPVADAAEVQQEYDFALVELNELIMLDALMLAVPHSEFKSINPEQINKMFGSNPVTLLDIKSFWDRTSMNTAGFKLWRL